MVRQPRALSLLVLCVAIAACSKPEPDPPTTPPAPTSTVLDDQLKALDKARAVQAEVDRKAQETQKAIDDAGG